MRGRTSPLRPTPATARPAPSPPPRPEAPPLVTRPRSGDLFGRHTETGRRNATELTHTVVAGSAVRVGIVGVRPSSSRSRPQPLTHPLGAPTHQVELANTPGFNRPCNFRGLATPEVASALRASLRASRAAGANATVAFGHFPLSTVAGRSLVQRELSADGSAAYLNGHLHDRLGNRLHAWHRPAVAAAPPAAAAAGGRLGGAFLELETADWKDIRRWRILAVDGVAGAHPSAPARASPRTRRLRRPPDLAGAEG